MLSRFNHPFSERPLDTSRGPCVTLHPSFTPACPPSFSTTPPPSIPIPCLPSQAMNVDLKVHHAYFTRALATEILRQLDSGLRESEVAREMKLEKSIIRAAQKSPHGNIVFNPQAFCFSGHLFLDLTERGMVVAKRVSLGDSLPEREEYWLEEKESKQKDEKEKEKEEEEEESSNQKEERTVEREDCSPLSVMERVASLLRTFPYLPFDALLSYIRSYEPNAIGKVTFRRLLHQRGLTVLSGVVLPILSQPTLEWRRLFCEGILPIAQNTFILSQLHIEMPVSLSGRCYISKSPKESSLYLIGGISQQGLSSLLVFDEESTKDKESFCMDIIQGLLPGMKLLLRSDTVSSGIAVDVETFLHTSELVGDLQSAFNGTVLCLPGSYTDLNPMREVWARLTSGIRPELFCYSKAHSLIRTLRIQWAEMRANRSSNEKCWRTFVNNYQQVSRSKGGYCRSHYSAWQRERERSLERVED